MLKQLWLKILLALFIWAALLAAYFSFVALTG